MINLNLIPKIELHCHLDGSVRPETIKELTHKNIKEVINNTIAPNKCIDLTDYLTRFSLPEEVMQTKENLERISYELAEDLIKDNVIYAEIRFAPLKHTKKGLTSEEVIDAVLKGFNKAQNIDINLILCMMRDMTYEENLQIITLAEKYKNKQVVAIDLAGAEKLYPTKNYKKLFEIAKEKNINYTIHAGEADGKESIQAALDFKTKRLGHGILITEDNNLINRIKKDNVLLEICPTSNIQTNIVDTYKNHPLEKLYKNNCLVSINTDNRTVSNTTLTKEYEMILKYLSLTISDIIKMNKNAIKYSFANEKTKQKINDILTNFEKEYLK